MGNPPSFRAERIQTQSLKGWKNGIDMSVAWNRYNREGGGKLTPHRFPLMHDLHGEKRIRETAGGSFG